MGSITPVCTGGTLLQRIWGRGLWAQVLQTAQQRFRLRRTYVLGPCSWLPCLTSCFAHLGLSKLEHSLLPLILSLGNVGLFFSDPRGICLLVCSLLSSKAWVSSVQRHHTVRLWLLGIGGSLRALLDGPVWLGFGGDGR